MNKSFSYQQWEPVTGTFLFYHKKDRRAGEAENTKQQQTARIGALTGTGAGGIDATHTRDKETKLPIKEYQDQS